MEAQGLACSGHPSSPLLWPLRPSKSLGPAPGLGHRSGPSCSGSQKPGAIRVLSVGGGVGAALRADEAAQRSRGRGLCVQPGSQLLTRPARRPPAAMALAGCGRGGASGRHDPAAERHAQLATLPALEGQGRRGAVGTGLAARGPGRHPLGVPADPGQRPETGVCVCGATAECGCSQPLRAWVPFPGEWGTSSPTAWCHSTQP